MRKGKEINMGIYRKLNYARESDHVMWLKQRMKANFLLMCLVYIEKNI